jgi:hypothetical protein
MAKKKNNVEGALPAVEELEPFEGAPLQPETAVASPSPGGEGRGEGVRSEEPETFQSILAQQKQIEAEEVRTPSEGLAKAARLEAARKLLHAIQQGPCPRIEYTADDQAADRTGQANPQAFRLEYRARSDRDLAAVLKENEQLKSAQNL